MILIYEQDLTHYRASFYDFLAREVKEELLILYGEGEPGSNHIYAEKDPDRLFQTRKIKRTWIGRRVYFQSLSQIREIVENNPISCVIHRGAIRNLNLFRELLFFKRKNIPLVIRGKGFSGRREFNPQKNFMDRIHEKIVNAGSAYLCYTEGSKKILDKYCDPEKVIVAVNTLNSELFLRHYNELLLQGKDNVKKALALDKEKYIIHVGRLTARKKIKNLIEIYSNIKKKEENTGLIIIGEGPLKGSLVQYVKDENIQDVVFTGALSSEDIKTSMYIFASDAFVIPGAIGLSINHAFLLGKPVIGHIVPQGEVAPENYFHGPECEYLVDGYNGIAVPNEDIASFSEAILKVLRSPAYSDHALSYAYEHLTVQKMAEGYMKAITKAKNDLKNK